MINAAQKLQNDVEAACPGIPVRAFVVAESLKEKALAALAEGERGPLLFCALAESAGNDSDILPINTVAEMRLVLLLEASCIPLTLAAMAATSCALAIERLTPQRPAIGWPGKILLDCGQVATVWVVAEQRAFLVGVNAAISQEPGTPPVCTLDAPYLSPGRLAGEIARGLLGFASNPEDRSFMEEYRDRSTVFDQNILPEACTVRVMGVDDDGALVILNQNGTPERIDDPAFALPVL